MRLAWCLLAALLGSHALGGSFAVLSIRQYRDTGPSDIHLYLYALDGGLLKQLTSTSGIDDEAPLFDSAGKTVLFFRHSTRPETKSAEGYALLDLATGTETPVSTKMLPSEERKHDPAIKPVLFSWPSDSTMRPDPVAGRNAYSCGTPDGEYRLIQRSNPAHGFDAGGWPTDNAPFLYFIRQRGTGGETALASFPGYQPYFTAQNFLEMNGTPFVLMPGFQALFMDRHMDSTTGDALWVLDLHAKKWTEMSENAGLLYFIPGRTGVTLLHSSRYEDLGKTGQVVTCGYLEFWGESFHPVRLGPPTSLFHGGAIFFGEGRTLFLPNPDYGS
jgi:hypothetical protein